MKGGNKPSDFLKLEGVINTSVWEGPSLERPYD